jgi:hypothetical protein
VARRNAHARRDAHARAAAANMGLARGPRAS